MSAAGLERELITPEGVDLRLQLGDGGERVSAFFLDVIVMTVALILLGRQLLALGLATGFAARATMGTIWLLRDSSCCAISISWPSS